VQLLASLHWLANLIRSPSDKRTLFVIGVDLFDRASASGIAYLDRLDPTPQNQLAAGSQRYPPAFSNPMTAPCRASLTERGERVLVAPGAAERGAAHARRTRPA
jgi:hypothetical protein